jgi:hypothetical protein
VTELDFWDSWDRDPWHLDADPWLERIRARDPARAKAIERRWRTQRAARARLEAQVPFAKADAAAELHCRMRPPWIRGLDRGECGRLRICYMCGGELPERRWYWCSDACVQRWTENHEWGAASAAAVRRDRKRCRRCGSTDNLEVNHRRPRVGRGYHQGCHHHLKLLETLCHDCHVDETNAQAERRRGAA